MATGALAVALTPNGVLSVANAAKSALLQSFGALSIPNPPNISTSVPSLGSSTDVSITISGGKFTPSSLSLSKNTQSSDGVFSIDATLTGSLGFSDWYEEDTTFFSGVGGGPPPPPSRSSFHSNQFVITFEYIKLTASIKLQLDTNNSLAPSVQSVSVTDKKFNHTLPSQTGLTSSIFGCVTDKVNSEISDKINGMTDGIVSSVHTGLGHALDVIPESGNLTSDIKYLFPGTPNGLVFPNNNGVQYRVLGKVQWKGQDAPGDVGTVPFPTVPTDGHDALFHVNNYDFNALFWAFFHKGDLNFSFNKSNVKFEPALNTSYYSDTPMKSISQKYPNRNMIVDLSLKEAPSTLLKEKEADITYLATVAFYVAKQGSVSEKDAELFSVELRETDALESFAVATNSSYLQLVTCHVVTVKEISVNVTSSNIPDTDPEMLKMLWKFILHPVYTDILDRAAQTGVPLPSALQGFFTNYAINIHPGYVSAAVNFTNKDKYERLLKSGHGISIPELKTPHINLAIM